MTERLTGEGTLLGVTQTSLPTDGGQEVSNPEAEARINIGFRGLVRDISYYAELDPTPEELASCRAALEERISSPVFPERYRRVLGLRYGIDGQPPLPLTEAGRELGGVSGARAGQLQDRALRILRRYTGNKVDAILGRDRETDPTPPYSRRIRRIDNL